MSRILFIFLDGVGLGNDDPPTNPFANAQMPSLQSLLGGRKLLAGHDLPRVTSRATLLALDACLGVDGIPQSATGQAVLLTGRNIPAELGYHYGPKPNPEVAASLKNGNIFSLLHKQGRKAALLNAYPPGYFYGIHSGRRLYSSIPLAVTSAGIQLLTGKELREGRALSADFTAQGWRTHLKQPDTPQLEPVQAGERLSFLARGYDLAFFEYWLTDYAGHHQDMEQAISLLEAFDQVLGGLTETWNDQEGLILITSDHGNLEDLSTRRHTTNSVPALLIGSAALRQQFADGLYDLTGIAPRILELLQVG